MFATTGLGARWASGGLMLVGWVGLGLGAILGWPYVVPARWHETVSTHPVETGLGAAVLFAVAVRWAVAQWWLMGRRFVPMRVESYDPIVEFPHRCVGAWGHELTPLGWCRSGACRVSAGCRHARSPFCARENLR